ncbi:MAG: flagellar hook-basal body complex protein FliE [Hyphomonadaceae bacterium]|nr:flagellar hook-basal body complex protein FliE [Hyphomonadaceae bacterium]
MDPVSAARAYQQAAQAMQGGGAAGASEGVDFGNLVQEAIRQAGAGAGAAEQQGLAVAAGQGDIVNVVTAIAAAETQLQTVIAVRDQVISAYQEILRMPI